MNRVPVVHQYRNRPTIIVNPIRRPSTDQQLVGALTWAVVNHAEEATRSHALLALQYGCLSGMREARDWLEHIARTSRSQERRDWADSILFP
jgi:hypothetical protein